MLQILVLFFSITTHAVEGSFSYKGDFELLQTLRFETVYPSTQAGQTRIQELLDDGYQCQYKLQFVQCSHFVHEVSLPASLQNFDAGSQNVYFSSIQSTTLLTEGDTVIQYEADQTVVIDGIAYSPAVYLESADVMKVSLGSSESTYHSFVIHPDFVSKMITLHYQESKWVHKQYLVEAQFVKN